MKITHLALTLSLVLVGFFVFRELSHKSAKRLPQISAVRPFSLIDQNERTFDLSRMHGNIWVANFFFTSCKGPCPLMAQKMARLQKEFRGHARVKLLSISLDPEHDQPEVLRAFGQKYGADFDRWYFVTGDKQRIIRLSMDAFKLPAGDDPNTHSVRFILIGPQGYVRGYYDSSNEDMITDIVRDVQSLLAIPSV